jgi:hypothetical protein
MWGQRNGILHGTDAKEEAATMISRHQNHINSHYDEFYSDPSIFLPVTIIISPGS